MDNLPRKAKSRLYKSELCRAFMNTGQCKYGGKCQYAHGECELRFVQKSKNYKTIRCKTFWTTGFCKYGNRCCFVHNDLGGSAFAMTPNPQPLPRAESQPAMSVSRTESQPMMFSPTIVEEPEDERVENDMSQPLWSKEDFTTSGGLDLNSIADCLVDEDDDTPEVINAFDMELSRAKARHPEHSCAEVCFQLEQRLGRKLSQEEVNKTESTFSKPEITCQPCDLGFLSAKAIEFTPLSRKHQSMPNVFSPSRKSSRLNVFQQLSEQDHRSKLFMGQGQAA